MGLSVLVTGANGFVGRHVVAALAAAPGLKLVATDLQPALAPLQGVDPGRVDYLSGNLAERGFQSALAEARHYDAVIHLAARLAQAQDFESGAEVVSDNLSATHNLLETCRRHDSRLLFASTAMVYGAQPAPFTETMARRPENFYALSKSFCEELIGYYGRLHGLSYAVFRIGVLYGPGQCGTMFIPALTSALVKGAEFAMTPGEQVRDFVYIDDLVELLPKALERREVNGIFNVGTGQAPTMKEVAQLAERLAGVSGLVRLGSLAYRENEVWDYRLDNSTTCQAFGWTPRTTLEQGLSATLEFHRSHKEA